jgi:hypothetical protein
MRADCLPNASVAIYVNGDALHEHHAESEESKTAACYVEAISGSEFSVVLTVEPGYAYLEEPHVFNVYLDGNKARSIIITPPTTTTESYTSSIDSVRRFEDGFGYYRKFTFAQHETSIHHIPMS